MNEASIHQILYFFQAKPYRF